MLKKIQNVWNSIIKKKKISNITNLYPIKNNFFFTNAISNSLVFYISTLKNIKYKNIKTVNKIITFVTPFNIILFILFILFLAYICFLL